MKKRTLIALCLVLSVVFTACGSSSSVSSGADNSKTPASGSVQEGEHTLLHGEVVSWNENEFDGKTVLVVKAKIQPNTTNQKTIDQNYYNVADIIRNQSGDAFDEIQYWAVADMTNGEESKVISFTLESDAIRLIADGSIAENQIGEYTTDLFIHQSLK